MALKKKPAKKKPALTTLAQIQEALSGASLDQTGWGIVRSIKAAQKIVVAQALKAKPGTIKAQKMLIDEDMEEWKNLQRIRSEARAWFDSNTFPYVVKGQRLFLKEKKASIWRQAEDFAEEIREAARVLDSKRSTIIAWGKSELGDAYDPEMYPSSFLLKFTLTIREHSIEPPSYLRHTDAEEYKRVLATKMEDIRTSMQVYERQCMEAVGQNIGRLIHSMTTEGGSPRAATLENLQKTFSRIASMRYEGTAVFKAAMEEAKEVISGVGIGELRRPGGVKKRTTERLAALMSRYKELSEAAVRKVTSEDSNPV